MRKTARPDKRASAVLGATAEAELGFAEVEAEALDFVPDFVDDALLEAPALATVGDPVTEAPAVVAAVLAAVLAAEAAVAAPPIGAVDWPSI
jgi:hypothetical protein